MPNDFDVRLERLLGEWEPRIGRPSCGPGCSRCCERMTVTVSSAEALELLEHLDFRAPELLEKIERRIEAFRDLPEAPDAALIALLDLGACGFLTSDGRCGVYDARPDACRACHVWHSADYCGREDFDMCTPAELNALRIDSIHRRMLAELDAGRRPFWGQLAPMVATLNKNRSAYLARADLVEAIEPRWRRSELIEFPCAGGTRAEIRSYLESELASLRRIFEEEPSPMGFPRAAEAPDRGYLDAFPLN